MANFKFKNEGVLVKGLRTIFKSSLTNKKLFDDIGQFQIDRIKSFSRLGKSLVTGSQFKPLSDGYVNYRKNFKKANPGNVGKLFGPAKSNITFTGQLLESLRYISDFGKFTVKVFVPATKRKPLPSTRPDKPPIVDDKTNLEVAKELSDNGREFMGMDTTGKQRIRNMIRSELRRQIARRGLKITGGTV